MQENLLLILQKFTVIGLLPLCGIEIEFYIMGDGDDTQVEEFLSIVAIIINLPIQSEKGYRQYEVATEIINNIDDIISIVNEIQSKLIQIKYQTLSISLHPKPYKNDYGSAMHIHLSLVNHNGYNIFNEHDTIECNAILMHTIGGILSLLNQALYLITGNFSEEFDRISDAMMCPSTISWGKNNRTTAIRIPDSSPHHRNRRVEFRVPSAQSSIEANLLFLLTATFYGIIYNIQPSQCVYGNTNDDIYILEKLYFKLEDAQNNYKFFDIFKKLCSNMLE